MIPVHGLYLHIPFCRSICPFCSFAVIKDSSACRGLYLEQIKKEYRLLTARTPLDWSCLSSVYIGGGTPSTLSTGEISSLLNWCDGLVDIRQDLHRSIEINPEDVDKPFCRFLKQSDITRYSLGVQSFDDSCLTILKRRHTGADSHNALENLQASGIRDFNIDLMFGYPGQSIKSLQTDIDQALQYNPSHLSVYSLTIEPKTRWNRDPYWSNWIGRNESMVAEMYELMSETITRAGFIHYEISNFCRPGWESRQNIIYWKSRNYLGLGLGAHSYLHPYRRGNYRRLVDYRKALDRNEEPFELRETIDSIKYRDEELMLALRMKDGLCLDAFMEKHDICLAESWHEKVALYQERGLLEINSTFLVPTLKGFLLSDEMSASLSACLDLPAKG